MKDLILLPTGDGICICLINQSLVFDIHIQLALKILENLYNYNKSLKNKENSFGIRVGINQNLDNLVIDINKNYNIAGAGINMAQRIMDKSDKSTIMVGEQVFQELKFRQRYINLFKPFTTTIKHGENINIYQLVNNELEYLNNETPLCFRKEKGNTPKLKEIKDLTKFTLLYFCILLKYKEHIKQNINDYFDPNYYRITIFYIAKYILEYLTQNEYKSNFLYDLDKCIDLETKIVDINKGKLYCKKHLDKYFMLDMNNYVNNELKLWVENKHFFETDTNFLNICNSFINDIQETAIYKDIQQFEFI